MSGDKEVHLSSIEGEGSFKRKSSNCSKMCGFKSKECKKCEGNLHGGRTDSDSGGNAKMVAPARCVISVD